MSTTVVTTIWNTDGVAVATSSYLASAPSSASSSASSVNTASDLASPTTTPVVTPTPPNSSGTSPARTAGSQTGTASADTSTASAGPPSKGGVSEGAVAGAAVGCLVAGLLLGAVAAFFLLRKKYQKNARSSSSYGSDTGHVAVTAESKGFSSSAPTPGNHGNNILISQFLLDSTPDKELAGELQSIGELVQQHVENHYHLRPVQASPQSLAPTLSGLGLGEFSKLGAEEVAALCIDPKTRQIGLQHVISHVVFASIDFNSRTKLSMLPAPISSFVQSVPPVESRGGNKDATSLALSQWRTLSAFLLHPSRSHRIPLSPVESEVSPKAQSLATALNACLHHFIPTDQGSQHQQRDHLQAVILECTRLGYQVLSQPGEWRFTYRAGDAGAAGVRPVVVCPGLDKLGGKDGKMYTSPQHVVAPMVAQVPRRSR